MEKNDIMQNLIKKISYMLESRNASVSNDIINFVNRIAILLEDKNISANVKQNAVKLLEEMYESLETYLMENEDITYDNFASIISKYDKGEFADIEEKTEEQKKIRGMLDGETEKNQISIPTIENKIQTGIENMISFLARAGVSDEILENIQGDSKQIAGSLVDKIIETIKTTNKSVQLAIGEILEEMYRENLQTEVENEEDIKLWNLTEDEERSFRQGEKAVLQKREELEVDNIFENKEPEDLTPKDSKQEDLRADDIF